MSHKWVFFSMLISLAVVQGAQAGGSAFPSFLPLANAPEGVAVDKVGNVYVSTDTDLGGDQIWKITPDGIASVLIDFGVDVGYACGLAVSADGDVYMARPLVPARGVYRVSRDGTATLVPGTDQILFADGLAFDQEGTLYITEVFSGNPPPGPFEQGGIWRVTKGGVAELWLRHDLLTGLAPTLFPFPLGANGIAFYHGSLYVANTDKMLVVRVPVRPDGSPGEPETWKQLGDVSESIFYQSPYFPAMIDGLSMDVHGNVYVASPSRLAIIRINAADKSQETIAVFPSCPLDGPLSLAFGTGNGERQNLFVTSSGAVGKFVPGLPWPGPGVAKIEVGIPGLPLP